MSTECSYPSSEVFSVEKDRALELLEPRDKLSRSPPKAGLDGFGTVSLGWTPSAVSEAFSSSSSADVELKEATEFVRCLLPLDSILLIASNDMSKSSENAGFSAFLSERWAVAI